MNIGQLLEYLKTQKIETWFDLGLFLDGIKEDSEVPVAEYNKQYERFIEDQSSKGIGFITFAYGIDGVTVEVSKYARIMRRILESPDVHFIAGKINPEASMFIRPSYKTFELPEIRGFNEWPLYKDFFYTKIERGDATYNRLIKDFWAETLVIVEKLGEYLESNDINLLYLINVCSNPGNVSLSLALVLISQLTGTYVINNNHDFYWEGGNSPVDLEKGKATPGPRDFFFTNFDVGEFFSIIEMLYPWQSRSWLNVNINRDQSTTLIEVKGHNPANVAEVSTAVDTERFLSVTRRDNIESYRQVATILSRYQDKLPVHRPDEVISEGYLDIYNPEPVLLGLNKCDDYRFVNSIIFLQPTRVMPRKKIGEDFTLAQRIFDTKLAQDMFQADKDLSLTIIVTGPIAKGHEDYLEKLLKKFSKMLEELPEYIRDRVFLGFLFSGFDSPEFLKRFDSPLGMPELYSMSSLVLLPSETEGRGLPIIEATACGRPIFCRRYYPENVYAEVVGEHLPEDQRLYVNEFHEDEPVTDRMAEEMTEWVFLPQKYADKTRHNLSVIEKRYSYKAMRISLQGIVYKLFLQLSSNQPNLNRAARALEKYKNAIETGNEKLSRVINATRRSYVPGFGSTGFMSYLKSLIDPSYFRVEEEEIRGFAMRFARRLVKSNLQPDALGFTEERIQRFYNSVESLFLYYDGEEEVRHDHSFSFRHRNRRAYLYRTLTHQELTGVINWLFQTMMASVPAHKLDPSVNFFTDWRLALYQCTESSTLAIDDREEMMAALRDNAKENRPMVYFPGDFTKFELEFFIIQSLRARLGLGLEDKLSSEIVQERAKDIEPIYIFCREKPFCRYLTYETMQSIVERTNDYELNRLVRYGLCKIIPTGQLSVGVHLAELGERAISILEDVREKNGFVIANGQHAAIMSDILDIERYHIGRADHPHAANILGIEEGTGFILHLPAGMRPSIAYPTPVQTGLDLSNALKSEQYMELISKSGKQKVNAELRLIMENKGCSIQEALHTIGSDEDSETGADISYRMINGRYVDKNPWSGALATARCSKMPSADWGLSVCTSETGTKLVVDFIKEFEESNPDKNVKLAWNGGYILNPELVGKLGIPESCIGAPLGMVIKDGKILSAPLFNKPALLVADDGKCRVERVSSSKGITLRSKAGELHFDSNHYNVESLEGGKAFYDLLYPDNELKTRGAVVLQLMGNRIHKLIKGEDSVVRLPVGLTLLVEEKHLPADWKEGVELEMLMSEFTGVRDGMEAGPLLLSEGELSIDMELEGWKTENSLRTQANRLDYLDLRGPKIATGITKDGDLKVLAVNGRIRESVGATHNDLAELLRSEDVIAAMGFDPGGSSTLVVNHETVNISPYNKDYEENVYSMPPQSRAVATALLLWEKK